MTTVKDILAFTESFAPLCTCADFDNCGILLGNKNAPVRKALLSLDITKAVIEEAKNIGAELIISHHPVIFNPLKNLSSDSVPYLLAKEGITALCLHTNLDRAEDTGVNTALANTLNLSEQKLYSEDFLLVGKLEKAMSLTEFLSFVKKRLNSPCVACAGKKESISTVAVSSGAGADGYHKAAALGADILLTGEARHHEYLMAAEGEIPLVTAGHFHTEDVVISPLLEKLSEKFPHIEFSKASWDFPVTYL